MIHFIRRLTTLIFCFSSIILLLEVCQVELTADNTALSIKNKCFHNADNNHRHPPIQYDKRRVYAKVLYRLFTHSLFYMFFFLSVLQTDRIPPKHKHMQINLYWNQSALITKQTSVVQLHNEWLLWVSCFYWIKDMLHNQYSLMPKRITVESVLLTQSKTKRSQCSLTPKWMTLMNLFCYVNQKHIAQSV